MRVIQLQRIQTATRSWKRQRILPYSIWRKHDLTSRILAWRIPMDRGAWRAIVHRVTKSRTWLNTHTHIPMPVRGSIHSHFLKSRLYLSALFHVCMWVYLCFCVCVCVCISVSLCLCLVFGCVYVYLCVCINMCVYYMCIFVCVYVCIFICLWRGGIGTSEVPVVTVNTINLSYCFHKWEAGVGLLLLLTTALLKWHCSGRILSFCERNHVNQEERIPLRGSSQDLLRPWSY